MAGAFRCKLNFTSILLLCVIFLEQGLRLFGKMYSFLTKYYSQIGATVGVLLAILNINMYHQSCRSHEAPGLPHGYAPLFPAHYFQQNSASTKKDLPDMNHSGNLDDLDLHFNSQVVKHSLGATVPPIVHIFLCEVGPFKYAHYLSVLAAFKILKPSILNLHVVTLPDKDPDGYYQFLDDLKRDLPPLLIKQLPNKRICGGNSQEKLKSILALIGKEGGIALDGNVIFVPSDKISSQLLSEKLSIGQHSVTKEPVAVFLQPQLYDESTHLNQLSPLSLEFDCIESEKFSLTLKPVCVFLRREIVPRMIFQGEPFHFKCLLRWIGYGSAAELVPKPSKEEIVPNIVHYVWLGKRKLKFFAYLSVLSAVHVLKAEAVYVHGDYEPEGELWQQIKVAEPRIKFIVRKFPNSVFGEPIVKFASHASDYLRGDLLLRYGGVYADWDVIFLKEMPPEMKRYNTTANVDWPATGAFPDVFNLGVLVAAPGAPFLRHFLESYRWYLDAHWSYNAIHIPYKVYEKVPWSLNVDRHLQILCARHKCHATWLKDYKLKSVDHLGTGDINWVKDALAIHWTYPDPPAFENMETLLKDTSPPAKIGQMVVKKAEQAKQQ